MKKNESMLKLTVAVMMCLSLLESRGDSTKTIEDSNGYTWWCDPVEDGVVLQSFSSWWTPFSSGSCYGYAVSPLPKEDDFVIPDDVGISAGNHTNFFAVTAIGKYAFCSSYATGSYGATPCLFKTVNVPDSVRDIGWYAFYNCQALKSVVLPTGLTNISGEAFALCTNLEGQIVIPNGQSMLCEGTFLNCRKLNSVVFPHSVKTIGRRALKGCLSLEPVEIPDWVTNIEMEAYSDLAQIKTLSIPDSVESIGEKAFQNCPNLERVIIGRGLKNLGAYAFHECGKLTSIIFDGNAPTVGLKYDKPSFGSCSSELTVYVRCGSVGWVSETSTDLPTKWCGIPIAYLPIEIRFDANGGSVECEKLECTPRLEYGDLPVPERTGFSFRGWYTAAEGGERVRGTSIVPDNPVVLYAHWKERTGMFLGIY